MDIKIVQFEVFTENILGEELQKEITLPISNISFIDALRRRRGEEDWSDKEYYVHAKSGEKWRVDEGTYNSIISMVVD